MTMKFLIAAVAMVAQIGNPPLQPFSAKSNPDWRLADPVHAPQNYMTFAVGKGRPLLTIDADGRSKCAGKRLSTEEARQVIGPYAAVYLAICNPPHP